MMNRDIIPNCEIRFLCFVLVSSYFVLIIGVDIPVHSSSDELSTVHFPTVSSLGTANANTLVLLYVKYA